MDSALWKGSTPRCEKDITDIIRFDLLQKIINVFCLVTSTRIHYLIKVMAIWVSIFFRT